jgi:RNA recognition motif-containing protein
MANFLLSWDMYGLESCIDLTEYEHEEDNRLIEAMQTGQDPGSKFGSLLQKVMLRARFNSHRHYEIYVIKVSEDINEQDIREMFEQNPNNSAELIRKRGQKLFSDRIEPTQQLIR